MNLGPGAILFAANPKDQWPFGISPDAKPILHVPLVVFSKNESILDVSGEHELIFDGCRYVSRIVFPAIDSYLISAAPGQFRWRRLDGTIVDLELGKSVPSGDRSWRLTRLDADHYRINSTTGDAESYDYSNCVLANFSAGGREYRFDYSEDRLIRIARIDSNLDETLLSIEYAVGGKKVRLYAAGENFTLEYGDDHELLSCSEDSAPGKIMTCRYSNGLLTEVVLQQHRQVFSWGQPVFSEYWRPISPLAPTVIADGHFEYRTKVDRHGMEVHFRASDGKSHGNWTLDFRTYRVLWTYTK